VVELDVHGMTAIKCILKTRRERENWIHVSQNGNKSRFLVNKAMAIVFHQMREVSWLCEDVLTFVGLWAIEQSDYGQVKRYDVKPLYISNMLFLISLLSLRKFVQILQLLTHKISLRRVRVWCMSVVFCSYYHVLFRRFHTASREALELSGCKRAGAWS
jgi:hypothetical protein